jgi:integrase
MPALVDPTEEDRRLVRAMSGFGIPQEQIATHLGIDAKTLRKHFRQDLDRGMVEATAKVAQSLFQMATTGKNVAAAIFWMKARAGWREKHEVEVRPLRRVEDLSDEELSRMIEACQHMQEQPQEHAALERDEDGRAA